uniref:Uncharacterized protein n=1 Tax=Anopheles arabiensis TaxID=7173 RepID=A0A182I5L6_ANOAR
MDGGGGGRFSKMWTTAVLNAITSRATSASKNLSVRYSSIPSNEGGPSASASNLSKIMGGGRALNTAQIARKLCKLNHM